MMELETLTSFRIDAPLAADEVALWRVRLDWGEEELSAAADILSADERGRAARFHRESDRRHFVVAHAVLRRILSGYLGTEPQHISLDLNPFGKPHLNNDAGNPDLRFSLSHSGGSALYAFAVGREVGVDLEWIEPEFATMTLVRNLFAPEEVSALSSLRGDAFVQAFYRCWTRKEAYVKARGCGLSLPLTDFVVSVRADDDPLLVVDRSIPDELARWRLVDVPGFAGFAAALAFESETGVTLSLSTFEFR